MPQISCQIYYKPDIDCIWYMCYLLSFDNIDLALELLKIYAVLHHSSHLVDSFLDPCFPLARRSLLYCEITSVSELASILSVIYLCARSVERTSHSILVYIDSVEADFGGQLLCGGCTRILD